MASLKDLRNDVAQTMTDAGLPGFAYLPERLSPPCAIVSAADPYMTSEDVPFGTFRMKLEVRLVTRPGANETVTDDLDDLIAQAITALDDTTWAVEDVSPPYTLASSGGSYLAASLTINDNITL